MTERSDSQDDFDGFERLAAAMREASLGPLGRKPAADEPASSTSRGPRSPSELDELARRLLEQSLGREPKQREVTALKLEGARRALKEIKADLDDVAARIEEGQAKLERQLEGLKEEISETVTWQVNFGSPAAVIDAVERGARRNGVSVETRVLKTGLFSRRVYFTFSASRLKLSFFFDALREWAERSGVGWRAV